VKKGFSTSIDYNRNSEEAKHFFATVQNKLHYAIHNHTASEIIYSRVDSEKEFMGLTIFKGELPTLTQAKVAKIVSIAILRLPCMEPIAAEEQGAGALAIAEY